MTGIVGTAPDAEGATAATLTVEFSASNTRYPITPNWVIAMTHYKLLLQRSWDRKDAINAALADETMGQAAKREGIESMHWWL
ncbi:hypothetical protein [Billgrantia gudaonensis]|uniref:hypothetical protein n=1 Tax=Billgrantia gudaonensis TaxID=376427 RepID=UPI001C40B96A|nr:hypothetical protein [Halomonas gudaonensis]